MRVKSVKTKNYRTLENIEINFSRKYSTISGKNNAGKSCVIRILGAVFDPKGDSPWLFQDYGFVYKEDKTQWKLDNSNIEIACAINISKSDDPAFVSFVEKIAETSIDTEESEIEFLYTIYDSEDEKLSVIVNGRVVSEQASKEIGKRIRQSGAIYLYNSTSVRDDMIYVRGKPRSFFEFSMSSEEKTIVKNAEKKLEIELKKVAKHHVRGLIDIFGRLSDRYDVELTPPEGFISRRMPLGINLKDRSVDVPIDDWGSGTQNRTRILMALLRANRIRTGAMPTDRITPLVVIEEPESFLQVASAEVVEIPARSGV